MLTVADTLQITEKGGQCFIHDSLRGNMLKTTPGVISVIRSLQSGNTLDMIEKEGELSGLYGKLQPLIKRGFLLESGPGPGGSGGIAGCDTTPSLQADEQAEVSPLFIRLYTTALCTQRCDYCHTTAVSGCPPVTHMAWETAKGALDEAFKLAAVLRRKQIVVQFYGGEPLLNFPVVEKVLEYGSQTTPAGCSLSFSLDTNGTVFSAGIAAALSRYSVDVHISLDGITEPANRYRKLCSGKPALALILKNIDKFIQCGLPIQLNASLTEANSTELKPLIDFAGRKGIRNIYLSFTDGYIRAAQAEAMAQRVVEAYHYSLAADVLFCGHWLHIFRRLFRNNTFINDANEPLFRIFINPAGDFYIMPYPLERIGRYDEISRFMELPAYTKIKSRWPAETSACALCTIAAGCGMRCKCNGMYHTGNKNGYGAACRFVKRIIDLLLTESDIWKEQEAPEETGLFTGGNSTVNCRWLKEKEELQQCINDYREKMSGKPFLIIVCVPDILPAVPDTASPLQMLFMACLDFMKSRDVRILSTASRLQFMTQCRDGFIALENAGIMDSGQYADVSSLWYPGNSNTDSPAASRNPQRVAGGIIRRVKAHGGITYLLRPGSLRIGDAAAELIITSNAIPGIVVIDSESPVDRIRLEALANWNCRDDLPHVNLDGNRFLDLQDADIAEIKDQTCIVLYCLAEAYNRKSYSSLVGEVLQSCVKHFGPSRGAWIAWPGCSGKPFSLNDLLAEKLDDNVHYTIVIRPG